MNVLIACEESQVLCKAFRSRGHEAYSSDFKPCSGGHPEWHLQGDVTALFNGGVFVTQSGELVVIPKWDLMIAHPPCTYLTVTANKWLKDQPVRISGALVGEARRKAQQQAIEFFKLFWYVDIPLICIENPVGVMSTKWKKPTQIIQPWQFGHKEPKKTCLWLKGLPPLVPTEIVEPEYHTTKSGKRLPKWYAYADKSEGQDKRAEIRSKTFDGISNAMAQQWTNIKDTQLLLL